MIGEWRCPKDREPYHIFTPVAVAYPASKKGSDNFLLLKENKQAELGCLNRYPELLYQKEGKIADHTLCIKFLENINTKRINTKP